jgi:hypothetical protein
MPIVQAALYNVLCAAAEVTGHQRSQLLSLVANDYTLHQLNSISPEPISSRAFASARAHPSPGIASPPVLGTRVRECVSDANLQLFVEFLCSSAVSQSRFASASLPPVVTLLTEWPSCRRCLRHHVCRDQRWLAAHPSLGEALHAHQDDPALPAVLLRTRSLRVRGSVWQCACALGTDSRSVHDQATFGQHLVYHPGSRRAKAIALACRPRSTAAAVQQ